MYIYYVFKLLFYNFSKNFNPNTNTMKRSIMFSSILAVALFASCKKNEPVAPTPAPTPPPVENPAPPAKPQPTTAMPAAAPAATTTTTTSTTTKEKDGTSVNISSDGLEVKNKNGDNKNNIELTTKKKEIKFSTGN